MRAEVKVLTAGAFKQVVLALVPDFEKQTGNKVMVDNDTAGGLQETHRRRRGLRRRGDHARPSSRPGRRRQDRRPAATSISRPSASVSW